jgi:hypothetical protein
MRHLNLPIDVSVSLPDVILCDVPRQDVQGLPSWLNPAQADAVDQHDVQILSR